MKITRGQFIERELRQIYGGFPSDDSQITENLLNTWLSDAIGVAAKQNYADNLKLEGIAFLNNTFYTTFKSLSVTADEQFIWKVSLPELPLGIGTSDGVSTIVFKDSETRQLSHPIVWLSENQRTIYRSMRPIPNKLLGYSQGEYVFVVSTIDLSQYTAQVTMASGGDSTNLDSTLNVPPDYYPVMVEYLKQQLMFQRSVPVDTANDGSDIIKTT